MKEFTLFTRLLPVLLLACALLAAPQDIRAQGPDPVVKLETSMGDILVRLDARKAPMTTANFLEYVKAGQYDGTIFHRVIKDFMIQGGGMTASLREKTTRAPIKNEADNGLRNRKYTIAMGILVTFGSYMKENISIEESTENVEVFDTAIAVMAGLMIIPAVFSFSGGDPDTLQAGPALMFITIPKVFESMGLGHVVGTLFFLLVLFAAITSSIALTESAVSTFEDELGWSRERATFMIGIIMLALGSLSALGYGPLAGVTVFGMQFLDFFDFLTNSVMMPIAAIATCLLVSRVVGVERIEQEVTREGKPFRRQKVFNFMVRYLCPIFAVIILVSSVANALGWIAM